VEQEALMYKVYIIYNQSAKKYYVGQTINLEIRLEQHNDHTFKSYTSRFPGEWKLIHEESVATRSEALSREKGFKTGRGREYKNQLFRRSSMVEQEAVNFEVTGSRPVC
jgi:putative endonuclease